MKRVQSNIVNVGFTILNQAQEVRDGQGRTKKVKTQGVEITHAKVNGTSAGVTFRTINGGQKSASVSLDLDALTDLQIAVGEILAVGEENEVN
jgi:hypothetical protein